VRITKRAINQSFINQADSITNAPLELTLHKDRSVSFGDDGDVLLSDDIVLTVRQLEADMKISLSDDVMMQVRFTDDAGVSYRAAQTLLLQLKKIFQDNAYQALLSGKLLEGFLAKTEQRPLYVDMKYQHNSNKEKMTLETYRSAKLTVENGKLVESDPRVVMSFGNPVNTVPYVSFDHPDTKKAREQRAVLHGVVQSLLQLRGKSGYYRTTRNVRDICESNGLQSVENTGKLAHIEFFNKSDKRNGAKNISAVRPQDNPSVKKIYLNTVSYFELLAVLDKLELIKLEEVGLEDAGKRKYEYSIFNAQNDGVLIKKFLTINTIEAGGGDAWRRDYSFSHKYGNEFDKDGIPNRDAKNQHYLCPAERLILLLLKRGMIEGKAMSIVGKNVKVTNDGETKSMLAIDEASRSAFQKVQFAAVEYINKNPDFIVDKSAPKVLAEFTYADRMPTYNQPSMKNEVNGVITPYHYLTKVRQLDETLIQRLMGLKEGDVDAPYGKYLISTGQHMKKSNYVEPSLNFLVTPFSDQSGIKKQGFSAQAFYMDKIGKEGGKVFFSGRKHSGMAFTVRATKGVPYGQGMAIFSEANIDALSLKSLLSDTKRFSGTHDDNHYISMMSSNSLKDFFRVNYGLWFKPEEKEQLMFRKKLGDKQYLDDEMLLRAQKKFSKNNFVYYLEDRQNPKKNETPDQKSGRLSVKAESRACLERFQQFADKMGFLITVKSVSSRSDQDEVVKIAVETKNDVMKFFDRTNVDLFISNSQLNFDDKGVFVQPETDECCDDDNEYISVCREKLVRDLNTDHLCLAFDNDDAGMSNIKQFVSFCERLQLRYTVLLPHVQLDMGFDRARDSLSQEVNDSNDILKIWRQMRKGQGDTDAQMAYFADFFDQLALQNKLPKHYAQVCKASEIIQENKAALSDLSKIVIKNIPVGKNKFYKQLYKLSDSMIKDVVQESLKVENSKFHGVKMDNFLLNGCWHDALKSALKAESNKFTVSAQKEAEKNVNKSAISRSKYKKTQ
jgi:hypothetical protein